MRSFVLQSILLISRQEKRARKFPFHPRTTLVRGDNGVGKSSLLKSIYNCFGAKPATVSDEWTRANVAGIATFTIDKTLYSVAQDSRRFALFDSTGTKIETYTSVTKGLGPALARLFGFDLKLPSRDNVPTTPPPAYMLLPFYIDQDSSWTKPWAAFNDLTQFGDFKRSLAEYHTGIKPNEYYNAKSEHDAVRATIKPLSDEKEVLNKIVLNIDEKMKVTVFDIDIENYREQIEELLRLCDSLHKKEEEIREALVHQYHEKTQVEIQIEIAKGALSELNSDYKFASRQLLESEVECPTCGQHYNNGFLARFSIARDEDRCQELLNELLNSSRLTSERGCYAAKL